MRIASKMERKEVDTQQFIDHSLLASELLRGGDPNHFIMDFIDHTGVFPKGPEAPTNLTTSNPGGNPPNSHATGGDSLAPDLGFHSSIFQFVNKASPETDVVVPQQVAQPSFPALAIEPTVPMDVASVLQEEEELLYATANASVTNARKVLPHKKRISRKLKACTDVLEHTQHKDATPAALLYSCEICGYAVHTQLDFFAHLKQHYEPSVQEHPPELPPLPQQKEPLDMCGLTTQDKVQQEQAKLDQVFQDVQLNFDNFHHHHVDAVSSVGVNMVMHGQPSAGEPCAPEFPVVTSAAAAANAVTVPVAVVDDVEFSDTEDMLEGIRNVVDKVSIEDTCDELVDLELTASGMRAPWFNNNFSDIAFPTLLMPGEPPPTATEPVPKVAAAGHMPLDFLSTAKQEEEPAKPLQEGLPKAESVVVPPAVCQAPEANEQPLGLSSNFKLEEVVEAQDGVDEVQELADSRPPSPFEEEEEEDEPSDSFELDNLEASGQEDASGGAAKTKRKHFCEKCSRNFNSYNALKYHQFTHNQEKSHKCHSCERSFYTQSALRAHERTHSDVKPFKCEKCEFKFRQWSDLKFHIISRHSDVKAHMCEFCGKSFSRRYSLVLHRRIHTSERNYACQFCEKTFSASSYLISHTKVHTGERPYECPVCGKKFRVSGDLKRHSRTHDPARAANPAKVKRKRAAEIKAGGGLKQQEDVEEEVAVPAAHNNKSDAICGEMNAGQEILSESFLANLGTFCKP